MTSLRAYPTLAYRTYPGGEGRDYPDISASGGPVFVYGSIAGISSWVAILNPSTGILLLETGDKLLMETGDNLLMG